MRYFTEMYCHGDLCGRDLCGRDLCGRDLFCWDFVIRLCIHTVYCVLQDILGK